MSPLIEAAGHWLKIRQLIQNIKVQISGALLTLAWFHNWEDKNVQIAVKIIFG